MDNSFDFSNFSRQSKKGILIIYLELIYKGIKLTWVLLFLFFKDYSKISTKLGGNYILLAITIIFLFFLVSAYLSYKNFKFKIKDNHFILQQGIFKKSNTSIPFHRIQNINLKQNIVQQVINVFEVNIETAGSSKTEIAIKALSFKRAKAIKKIIANNQITNDVNVTEKEKPLVKVSVIELFKVSLTENHLQNLLIFLAVIVGFFQQVEPLFKHLSKKEFFNGLIKENTNTITQNVFLLLFLLFMLLVTAFITSFSKIFLTHYNLITYLKKEAFEINQGLFTKKSIALKKQKIQNITISTNPLKRMLGISFLTFKQAISGALHNKNKDKLIRIVGCKKDQIEIIKTSLFNSNEVEIKDKKHPENYYKKRLFVFSFLFLIISYLFLGIIFNKVEIFYSIILVLPLTVFLIFKKVKKQFYKISDDLLLVGSGLIETHFTYLELFKVQNIKMKQTFFQEKNNVADLILQTASGKINIPCIKYRDAVKIYNYILFKVETSTKSWM